MAYVYYKESDLSIQVLTLQDLDEPWPRFEYPDEEVLPFLIGEKHVNKYHIKMVDGKPIICPKPIEIVYPNIDYKMYHVGKEHAPIEVIRDGNKITINLLEEVSTVRRYPNLYFTKQNNPHVLYHTYQLDLEELNKKKTITIEISKMPRASLYINRFVDMSYEEN